MIHDHINLDALIAAAKIHPTESLIQKIIDKELDYNGNHCEPDFSAYIWRKIFHINSQDTVSTTLN